MHESKSEIIERVRKERNSHVVDSWHAECDRSINDPCIHADVLSYMIRIRPMYDYIVHDSFRGML